MLALLLPLLFNPLSLFVNWFSLLYLISWPVIVQTFGSETLLTHALISILYIVVTDLSRQFMLKTLGFDIVSFPLGVAFLIGLLSEPGSQFMSLATPIFNSLIWLAEPVFLVVEVCIVIDITKRLNQWLGEKANKLEENSRDLFSERELTSGAFVWRAVIIILTLASYRASFLIIQEAKALVSQHDNPPLEFN